MLDLIELEMDLMALTEDLKTKQERVE